jgi:fermentation-respiration switch protein FrsA (DUF1100 family)
MLTCFTAGIAKGQNLGLGPLNPLYEGWCRVNLESMSKDGKWVSYALTCDHGEDTLFVKSTTGNKVLAFPKGMQGNFLDTNWFACIDKQGLALANLTKLQTEHLGTPDSYGIAKDHETLYYAQASGENSTELHIRNIRTGARLELGGVESYSYNTHVDKLAVILKEGSGFKIVTADIGDLSINEIFSCASLCTAVAWQDNGRSLAFIIRNYTLDNAAPSDAIGWYSLESGTTEILDINSPQEFIRGSLSTDYGPLVISKDGKAVYFNINPIPLPEYDAAPEIWNSADRVIYPAKAAIKGWATRKKVAMWRPREKLCRMLTTNRYPSIMLAGDLPYALVWDPFENEPDPNLHAPVSYYVLDKITETIHPLLSEGMGFADQVNISPTGRFLSYFKQGHWWVYEFTALKHSCLTCDIPYSFQKASFDWPDEPPGYSIAGWAADEKAIYLYDQFDLWEIVPGGTSRRITSGREKKESFRLTAQYDEQRTTSNFDGSYAGTVPMDKPLLFKVNGEEESYCVRQPQGKWKRFVATEDMLSSGYLSQAGTTLAYMRQNYTTPTRIEFISPKLAQRTLYRGNSRYAAMEPFRAEKISYTNSAGVTLEGILYYPWNYDPKIRYPMVVNIYEKQVWEMNKFIQPSYNNSSGFNVSNYIMDGYFVLRPDIVLGFGNPGEFAVDCVESAVRSLLGRKDIDASKIGLIGHSFGGYETDYILTRSGLFAVAVSGAAINDVPSFYHFVVPVFDRPNFWHMEYGQFRINKPYHQDPEFYNRASPLFNSHKIITPLLSWNGMEDGQVHYTQMIDFHLSLRRQGKTHIALLYPNEGHILTKYENRKDLTLRISQWFGHYLKGEPKPEWAKNDIW